MDREVTKRKSTKRIEPTLTLLPSVGSPDWRLGAKLMAPVILSIWDNPEYQRRKKNESQDPISSLGDRK